MIKYNSPEEKVEIRQVYRILRHLLQEGIGTDYRYQICNIDRWHVDGPVLNLYMIAKHQTVDTGNPIKARIILYPKDGKMTIASIWHLQITGNTEFYLADPKLTEQLRAWRKEYDREIAKNITSPTT